MLLILSRPFEPPVATPLVARASVHSGICHGENLVNATPQGLPWQESERQDCEQKQDLIFLDANFFCPRLSVSILGRRCVIEDG